MYAKRGVITVLLIMIIISSVLAHEEVEQDHGLALKQQAAQALFVAGIFIFILILIAIIADHKRTEHTKWILFLAIVIPALAATGYVALTTIYINQISATQGPVHWHADFEIWNCGEKIELKDPRGLSNRIGTPIFHEHNDNRIHLEGVPINLEDFALHHFIEVVGGVMTEERLSIPTNTGMIARDIGDNCNGKPGKIQLFVYEVVNPEEKGNWQYQQRKIIPPTDYLLQPYSAVPPGSCIIIEFSEEKEETNHICESYRIAQGQGERHGR